MPESKSGALTSLAIPLRNLQLAAHLTTYLIEPSSNAATGKILFYNSLFCKSDFSGCCLKDRAFHAFQLPGTCPNT
jgi:hypothetical protein